MKTILTCLLLVIGAVVALHVLPGFIGAAFGLTFGVVGAVGGVIVTLGATVLGLVAGVLGLVVGLLAITFALLPLLLPVALIAVIIAACNGH